MYMILPESYYKDKVIILIVSGLELLYTLFFTLPVLALMLLHIKNFCTNRTTNERFTNKKYSKPKEEQRS